MNSTDTIVPDYALDLINDVVIKQGFKDFVTDIAPGSNHADGFLGILSRVTIKGIRNGKQDTLSMILKMPPSNKARREQFGSAFVFEREIFAYTVFLPTLKKFQEEKGLTNENGFFQFAECYGVLNDAANERYALVLEDLKAVGYDMLDKLQVIDLEHLKLALCEMGRLHGVSYAIRDQKPDIFKKFEKLYDIFEAKIMNEATAHFRNISFDRALTTLDPDNTEAVRKLTEIKENFDNLLADCVRLGAAGRFAVVNHGDCWSNNMMFSYKSNKQIEKICLIDWQLLRCGSPVLDLMYFLFTSTHKAMRQDHYNSLIHYYHKSATDIIDRLGSDSTKLFSFSDLQDQLKKFGKYALLMAPMLLQVITADPKDIPDMDEVAEKMEKPEGREEVGTMFQKGNKQSYEVRMKDVIEDVFSYGYY